MTQKYIRNIKTGFIYVWDERLLDNPDYEPHYPDADKPKPEASQQKERKPYWRKALAEKAKELA